VAAETRIIPATIARVNGQGFQTREDPGKWFNLSKYATPPPAIPPAGTEVRITLDGSGYVRAIEPVDTAEAVTRAPGRHTGAPPTKDVAIIRMNALKCAARLLGQGAETDSLLALAGKLEAWIAR